MFTLLIPFLVCLAGIQAAEAGQDFKEPVTVHFLLRDREHTANNSNWRDWSRYESPDLKAPDTTPAANKDVVGSLVFKHANGSDAHRVITWSKDRTDKTLRLCLVSLSEDPETSSITVELSPSPYKESSGTYKGFHLQCAEEIQSAAGGYPVGGSTSSSASSTVRATPTAAISAADAYKPNPPFKNALLVNFMAAPEDLADPAAGGWTDNTDYGWVLDSSPGILDDNDKKPPVLPGNTDSQVVLGQMKFYSWSATARKYSWQPKAGNGGDSYRNCTLKITSDPSVNEVWVWPVSGAMWPMSNGTLMVVEGKDEEEVKTDFKAKMQETQAIVNRCEPPE